MPFGYYRRLSKEDKAIYRQSDEYIAIDLPEPKALTPVAEHLERALAADDRIEAERAAEVLVRRLTDQLEVEPVSVRVLSERPRSADEELHGLYVLADHENGAVIQVWMRTAARGKIVSYRTFLRTLLHEVCHHLDYELLELADSFHTEGFFRRESSLVRQIAGPGQRRGARRKAQTPRSKRAHSPPAAAERSPAPEAEEPDEEAQLELFATRRRR